MINLTKAQRKALKKVYDRENNSPLFNLMSYRQFRKTVLYGSDCIMVPWCGMWLGIEKDGYTHS